MLTIILGLVLVVLFLWLSTVVKKRDSRQLCLVVAGTVFIVAFFSGIWGPLSGYGKWEFVDEISLIDLPEYTTFGEIEIEEIKDGNNEAFIVREYQRKGKVSIWTFAFDTKETKYIFYVPEGTISKDVNLN